MLYENDVNYCKSKSMGIVLKRRDNANIVKDCYGGIINILMAGKSSTNAVNFTREFLKKMIDEKFPLDKLIISKSLRGFYKNPDSIAHRVLANRMGRRDPGTKPSIGSRVQYVYIQTKKKMKLQGDRIESPEFIIKNKDLSGPVNIVSPNPVTNAQYTKILSEVLHRPAFFNVPAFILKSTLGEMADELLLASSRCFTTRATNPTMSANGISAPP